MINIYRDIIFQFQDADVGVERTMFESFYYEQWIYSDVIDMWCILLNCEEFRRYNSKQTKLYCNTHVTVCFLCFFNNKIVFKNKYFVLILFYDISLYL